MTDQLTAAQYVALTPAQRRTARQDGRLADALAGRTPNPVLDLPPAPPAPSTDGAGKVGTPVSGPGPIRTRAQYAALSPEERRAAREEGLLDDLLRSGDH